MVTLVVQPFNYTFETNTNVGADPGAGDIRLNNATQKRIYNISYKSNNRRW